MRQGGLGAIEWRIDLLLNATALVIECCKVTGHSTAPSIVERSIRNTKKCYASALRYAGRLSFTVEDVRGF